MEPLPETAQKITDGPHISLPNGSHLTPGGRVRIPRSQAMKIPEETIENHGLLLDDDAASHESEVVVWPAPPAQYPPVSGAQGPQL